MKIAIFGTGAVGGYFGGRLAQGGEEVVFIARGKHLQALQASGLKVDSINGDFTIHPVQATDDPSEAGVVDAVIVGVKAWQVPEAAEAMWPMVGPQTFVVPLQNGVDAPSQLAAVLGAEHVLGGLCGLMSFVVGPGHIQHAGIDPFVNFGELDNRASDRTEKLRQAFVQANVNAEIPPDIQVATWRKFLFIVSVSGMGAVTRSPMGVFRELSETRKMLEQVLQEVFQVARAQHVNLPDDAVGTALAFIDGLPAEGTASMQRDIMEGRPSELEAQNGAVVRLGQEVGVETPVNAFIYHSLLPMELRARGQMEF
ncbi:MAG: 2-dehydropantoate 2-reductase [Desulfobacterales bacterium]|jgi:2-dehydropantoate 2-reductase